MNITTATPAQIDTELARLQGERTVFEERFARVMGDVRRTTGERPERTLRYGGKIWATTVEQAIEKLAEMIANDEIESYNLGSAKRSLATAKELREQITAIHASESALNEEFRRRGGWTRAFLCLNNDGHVHSSLGCSTLRFDTSMGWVITVPVEGTEVEVSGMTQAQVIELAGEKACTVCYPDAPVTDRPTQIFDRKTAAEKQARAKELQKKRDAKAAKAIVDPETGGELRVKMHSYSNYAELIKTEVSAQRIAVELLFNSRWYNRALDATEQAALTQIVEALAAKRGTSADDQRELVQTKANQKYARESR